VASVPQKTEKMTRFNTLLLIFTMGIFGNLFGQNKHVENFEFFIRIENDFKQFIVVDTGLDKIAPINAKPNILKISFQMNNVDEEGLSSSEEELKIFGEIEDKLIETLTKNEVFVGRITSNGLRDFYFYTKDNKIQTTLDEALKKYNQFKYTLNFEVDEKWNKYYKLLYPSDEEFQKIGNRSVLDNLEEGGDNLTLEREVFHWIYFKTEKDRENYLVETKKLGFTVVSKEKIKDEFPYQLQIKRIDKVDEESVNNYVIQLWKLAPKYSGNYDGWETSIEKEQSTK
jgi:uncharacterized protein (TIGR01619 family)